MKHNFEAHEFDGSDRRQIEVVTYIISGDTKNNIEEFEFYWHLPLPSSGATIDDKTHVGGVIKIVNNSRLIEQNILFEPWGKLPRKIKKYVAGAIQLVSMVSSLVTIHMSSCDLMIKGKGDVSMKQRILHYLKFSPMLRHQHITMKSCDEECNRA